MSKEMFVGEIEVNYKKREIPQEVVVTSQDAERFLRRVWSDKLEYREAFYLIPLNRANRVLGYSKLSEGGICGTVLDVRIVFQTLLKANACAFVMAHNHPGGGLIPSEQDRAVTKRIEEAAKLFDITLLDHLILTESAYLSFADEGMI